MVTKPYEFIWFGAMDVTKPYEFIGFGAMDVTKPYEFIGLGAKLHHHLEGSAFVSALGPWVRTMPARTRLALGSDRLATLKLPPAEVNTTHYQNPPKSTKKHQNLPKIHQQPPPPPQTPQTARHLGNERLPIQKTIF